jgi:hypothetical protein
MRLPNAATVEDMRHRATRPAALKRLLKAGGEDE